MISQLVVIATPALLMTIMLTRRPDLTLLLRRPPWLAVPMAFLLAVVLNPLIIKLHEAIIYLYPMSDQAMEQVGELNKLFQGSFWPVFLLVAVLPAICEELAFRGFILSGLRHLGHRWRAILISSIIFGIVHPILQQSLLAAVVGAVIGYIAVQTGSLLPGIVFHLTHNATKLLYKEIGTPDPNGNDAINWIFKFDEKGEFSYQPGMVVLSVLLSILILAWFARLTYARSVEEALQDKIDQNRFDPSADSETTDKVPAEMAP